MNFVFSPLLPPPIRISSWIVKGMEDGMEKGQLPRLQRGADRVLFRGPN